MIRMPRIILYTKNLRYFTQCCQLFSSESGNQYIGQKESTREGNVSGRKYQEREICLFGPKDMRAPLPGNIGIAVSSLFAENNNIIQTQYQSKKQNCDLLKTQLPEERYKDIIGQLMNYIHGGEIDDLTCSMYSASDMLECVAQECPELLRKDFADLFPGNDISQMKLTVITICQKTKNNMSIWSEEMEIERDNLMECFIKAAQEICEMLKNIGYWADFIDPSSGRPFLGPYTNATMFETDERYRHFGFIIEDLGCCKVISHHLWGSHAFVGCLFTNAPLDCPEVCNIVSKHKIHENI